MLLYILSTHACYRHLGCSDTAGCTLCASARLRRCASDFCPKFLVGDSLRASCGAVIRIEAIDSATLKPPQQSLLDGVRLEVCIVNAQALGRLTGVQKSEGDLMRAILLTNSQGGGLITYHPKSDALCEDDGNGKLLLSFVGPRALLTDVRTTGTPTPSISTYIYTCRCSYST